MELEVKLLIVLFFGLFAGAIIGGGVEREKNAVDLQELQAYRYDAYVDAYVNETKEPVAVVERVCMR